MVNRFYLLALPALVSACTGSVFYLLRRLKKDRQFISPCLFVLYSDTGFAGRWVLTVHLFITTSLLITIYLLARNMITKFNKSRIDKQF